MHYSLIVVPVISLVLRELHAALHLYWLEDNNKHSMQHCHNDQGQVCMTVLSAEKQGAAGG